MPAYRTAFVALFTAALAGCGFGNAASDGAVATTPEPPTLPGVYAGRFPCSNCSAIEATLWLRPDGRFVLRQRLQDDTTSPAHAADTPTYGLGYWRWDDVAAEAVLEGRGPVRRLTVLDADRLRLIVASPVEHVLSRDATAPAFTDRLVLDGESAVADTGATFHECLTGLQWPVTEGGAYRELRRQHRRLNPRGKVALTTVEAHLEPGGDAATPSERLVVDRVLKLKPGTGC